MDEKVGNNSLLCYLKPIMIFIGALPHTLIDFNKNLYILYQYMIQGAFLLFLILLYIGLSQLHGPIDQIFQSISVLAVYSIMYVKGLVCLSKNIRELIHDMVTKETLVRIRDTADAAAAFMIYKVTVNKSKNVQIFYITLTYSTCIAFIIPSVKYRMFPVTSSTKNASEHLPYVMWMPLDQNEHNLTALIIQIFCAFLATNYYCFIQCILVILPLNVNFRLKVLASNLRSVDSLVTTEEVGNREDVRNKLRCCIIEHIDIIRNCRLLSETIKYLMLLEFLLSSAQISLILFEITTTNDKNLIFFSLFHIFQVLVQLLILYWYADEIRVQSSAISIVLYGMKWYQYNKTINKSIQIMMIRSQRPLSLTVGPFGEMSLAMAMKVTIPFDICFTSHVFFSL
ncbi:hypothetical protein NQ315_000917 [Exocentrus adspersus]|uniref:Odorant receptor n=1 Tax=Exocentrus adspersus TaxID=1586481 RepID=A0AAV8WDZ6_9CUCU|nr:hypothetical protein NQ315_000917 [Exocentrus adspersus]